MAAIFLFAAPFDGFRSQSWRAAARKELVSDGRAFTPVQGAHSGAFFGVMFVRDRATMLFVALLYSRSLESVNQRALSSEMS